MDADAMILTAIEDAECRLLVGLWPRIADADRVGALALRARSLRRWIEAVGLVDCVRVRVKARRVVTSGLVRSDGTVAPIAAQAIAVRALATLGAGRPPRRKRDG